MDQLTPITKPYLLVSGIKCYVDSHGGHYVDKLWHKDLVEHCKYLKNFTLAAPCISKEPLKDMVKLEEDPLCSAIRIFPLPSPSGYLQALLLLPLTFYRLWSAIGQHDIVHSGVANWPIPYAWLIAPLAKIRQKFHVIIIESAFWRRTPGVETTWKFKIRSAVSERLNRACVNAADLAIFTEESYRQSLLTDPHKTGYVIQASWIDQENILPEAEARRQQQGKSSKELKVLFAGQLNARKGVLVLLEAMKILAKEKAPVKLDILGHGELLYDCQQTKALMQSPTQLEVLGSLPYGPAFFHCLQRYHAIVVPSLSDEQPRIVYDAYSQAIPLLATKTSGLLECIVEGQTGFFAEPNDPQALAQLFKKALSNMPQLQVMGMQALSKAHGRTHQTMHEERWRLLLERIP